MYEELKIKLGNVLEGEMDYVIRSETDNKEKFKKLNDIMNMTRILSDFEELEPVIAEYINKQAQKKKWERGER